MKELKFSATIAAPKQKVWDTMIGAGSYEEWTNVSWPGSTFEGKWEAGEKIRFVGHEGSGTLAQFTNLIPYEEIVAEHIAMLSKGVEDRESDMAKTWVGSIEQYNFTDVAAGTEVVVTMKIHPDWADMFEKDWPKALAKLKEICER